MKGILFEKLKKELPKIKKGILLKDHTTFKIGGPAEYFLIVKEKYDLMVAIEIAKKFKLPVFVLGGGSNLLVSDRGVKGLVIKLKNDKINFLKNNIVSIGAGAELKKIVESSINKSLEGLEWAGGLPGSFGGAVRGNAGAFGGETKDIILEVKALDKNLKLRKFSNKQCKFSYRSSIFKKKNWTVVSATIKLKKGDRKSLQEIAQSRIDYRKERHPLEYPNAGSIFKNVDFEKFSPKFKESLIGVVKKDPFPVVPTAYLISEAGLKGTKIGQAQVSEKHPNFIVNLGGATAKDVLELIDLIKKKIKKVYSIDLETECIILEYRI